MVGITLTVIERMLSAPFWAERVSDFVELKVES